MTPSTVSWPLNVSSPSAGGRAASGVTLGTPATIGVDAGPVASCPATATPAAAAARRRPRSVKT
jgi:hypothetical protein